MFISEQREQDVVGFLTRELFEMQTQISNLTLFSRKLILCDSGAVFTLG